MINNKVTLVDISFWQDNDETPYKVDFSIMKSKGIDGVILRAGQNTWVDEDFKDYAYNAILAGHLWGVYWFYDSRSNPESQAALLQETLKGLPTPPLGIWGDYEEGYGGAWGGGAHFRVFIEELKERFPQALIGVYTGPSYWETNTRFDQRDWFKQFPLWIANYGVINPRVPYPWTTYAIWQYTDKGDGYKYGVESHGLDMNLFRGTFDDYKRFFGLPQELQPTEIEQEGELGMFKVWSNTYRMSLRRTNEVTGTFIEYIPTGTIMKADRISTPLSGGLAGDKWAHVVDSAGVQKDGWVAIIHNGIVYCQYEEIPQTGNHVVEVYVDGVLEFKKEF